MGLSNGDLLDFPRSRSPLHDANARNSVPIKPGKYTRPYVSHRDLVQEFCGNVPSESFCTSGTAALDATCKHIVLQSYDHGSSKFETRYLTTADLYSLSDALRYVDNSENPQVNVNQTPPYTHSRGDKATSEPTLAPNDSYESHSTVDQSHDRSSERRLILIHNPDRYALFALLAAIPNGQKSIAKGFVESYLSADHRLELNMSSAEGQVFNLEFNLPYFAVRMSSTSLLDNRAYRRGGIELRLRRQIDVSYINWQCSSSTYLCEAQVSFNMLGRHSAGWTACELRDILTTIFPSSGLTRPTAMPPSHFLMRWT